MGKHKTVTEIGPLSDTLSAAKMDLEGLAEEIRSWEENMSGTGLENTSKYETVSECADEIENIDMDFVDSIIAEFEKDTKLGLKEELTKPVETLFSKPYSKFESRPTRLARVIANLEAARDRLEAIKDRIEEAIDEADIEEEEDGTAVVLTPAPTTDELSEDDLVTYIEDWIDDLDNAIDEMSGISFPGMF